MNCSLISVRSLNSEGRGSHSHTGRHKRQLAGPSLHITEGRSVKEVAKYKVVWACASMCAHTHHTHAETHTHTHTHALTYPHTMRTLEHTCTHMHTCICIVICAHTHACNTHARIQVHEYAHTRSWLALRARQSHWTV